MAEQNRSDDTRRTRRLQAENEQPEWRQDLNPDHMAGQNVGAQAADREQGLRTAYDVKPLHREMSGWEDDDLKRIPVLPEGQRLQQGATYLDLGDPGRGEFTAMGNMEAGAAVVPKDRVPYSLWNRLRGVDDVERTLGEGADR
ncbi:MAG TPA: hypothetical protein VHG51_19695 [Longimicrobiaceae bacterium]|nr:hypothetical protein [Longimicrobiaceae bacterium]